MVEYVGDGVVGIHGLALRVEFVEALLTERVLEQPGCFATEVGNERGCRRPLWVGGVGLERQRGLSRGRCRGGGEAVCGALDDGCAARQRVGARTRATMLNMAARSGRLPIQWRWRIEREARSRA